MPHRSRGTVQPRPLAGGTPEGERRWQLAARAAGWTLLSMTLSAFVVVSMG